MNSPRNGEGYLPSPIQITDYKIFPSGALQGFATVETPSGFTIHGVAIFNQGGERWCGLPTKPRLSGGKAVKARSGGWVSDQVLEIKDSARKKVFDRAVLSALDDYMTTLGEQR